MKPLIMPDTAKAQAKVKIPANTNFIDKNGKVWPLYQTKTGKLYYVKVSKNTGKEYNAYLK